ncbi:adenylate/guanylate cyclase domain-containing protein [Algoriphagus litoralis]|uniref:adenylate/guanylate cyclase domain-containing protein n=1 Tax=Algoriphagus litoralis TaxID=2202829 RepID=UPI000DB95478|nr:adenylate/guanylate cyclase domain-containing protein [Algoriphagus litoralis]
MKRFLVVLFFFLNLHCGFSQTEIDLAKRETLLDSLKERYFKQDSKDPMLLEHILQNEPNPDSILKYAQILVEKSLTDSAFIGAYYGYLQLGNGHVLRGELSQGLDYYFQSLAFADRANYQEGRGKVFLAIADTYSQSQNSQNAAIYYGRSIEILRNGKDSLALASGIFNAGDEYLNLGKLDSALLYTLEAKTIFQKVNYRIGEAYCFGNLGMIYAQNGDNSAAEENLNTAIEMLEMYREFYPISVYLEFMSSIYLENGDRNRALNYANRSLELANHYGLKDQISNANLILSKIYERAGDSEKALEFYKKHIIYRDSVNNISAVQQMANLRTDYEVSQKQIEVDLLEKEAFIKDLQTKRQQFIIYGVVLAMLLIASLAFAAYRRYRYEAQTKKIIEEEKNRSEELLLNILPHETAEELKLNGKVKARRSESVTVLFTDFKNFTAVAENTSPEQLVSSLDFYFKEFDEICTRHNLEKIKTIGDSYMCAGGLPKQNDTHPRDVILAAKEMMAFVNGKKEEGICSFEMRVGIHTGPVVAGIVGIKKWQYDIWGDTVNIASRMESNSVPGKINLSETTYKLIQDEFDCEFRGSIDIKNRGTWEMYFLKD